MKSFYAGRPARSFWKTGVCEQPLDSNFDLYRKKFAITPETRIMTAGSCFAQHIGTNLAKNGFNVIDREPPPRFMAPETARSFGYKLYSARYGNIYTMRQLLQLVQEVTGKFAPALPIWMKGGRYFDALRPGVEPEGLDSPEEVTAQRQDHLKRVRLALRETDLLIFTFGLTEGWIHKESGTVYPTAPGTIAGDYDPDVFAFHNFTFEEIYSDFLKLRRLLKKVRPELKFLVTVSPVPLTATASDSHVLPATIYSKSVLRAVAGQLQASLEDVDYFPSYEIVSTPFFGKIFYEPNMRSVAPEGVEAVMRIFFHAHTPAKPVKEKTVKKAVKEPATAEPAARGKQGAREPSKEELVCEEMLLESFAK